MQCVLPRLTSLVDEETAIRAPILAACAGATIVATTIGSAAIVDGSPCAFAVDEEQRTVIGALCVGHLLATWPLTAAFSVPSPPV